jgi:hypothetical protein
MQRCPPIISLALKRSVASKWASTFPFGSSRRYSSRAVQSPSQKMPGVRPASTAETMTFFRDGQ